jgi:hypothetical protein
LWRAWEAAPIPAFIYVGTVRALVGASKFKMLFDARASFVIIALDDLQFYWREFNQAIIRLKWSRARWKIPTSEAGRFNFHSVSPHLFEFK